jgi:hypothetical protein
MYKQGLKDTVKAEIIRSGAVITTLNDIIDKSIRLNNAL